ncbi:hypothetical protein PIROE2DRAFT_8896 [Piromyces sp. E2]|nr:hypothetical protein PIROE2DRAFT_8896 [Piromyces sp. E2]|eukprot:OUM64343.1 hypothetical protein PIROE2DRAFT_8896 [Piromyces sp. E2]
MGYRLIDTATSGVKREEIFVSIKLWPNEYENPNAVNESLERFEKAYKEGKIKVIGVSNFEGKFMEDLLSKCEIKPQINQVEAHPYFVQEELRKITEPSNIKIMSEKYNKTPVQIILKWHTQMGFIVIPGSKNVDHIRENFSLFDFELTAEDMEKIATFE